MLQMASPDMEMRVRAKLGLAADQQVNWSYKTSDFSPTVRQLTLRDDSAVLGKGINGQVC